MLNKEEEIKFIKEILGDNFKNEKCFTWKELGNYYHIIICAHRSHVKELADAYISRGVSFLEDPMAAIECIGECEFSCLGLGFLISREVSENPVRSVFDEVRKGFKNGI